MNLKSKKSRVSQLRDLFQSGRPLPSEELGDIDLSTIMLTKNIIYTKLQKKKMPELKISNPNESTLCLLSHDNNSDSDVDSPKNSNSQNENESKSAETLQLSMGSTLNSIDPFPGNEPQKMRPLGEEFRARRKFKSLKDKSIDINQKSLIISETGNPKKTLTLNPQDEMGNLKTVLVAATENFNANSTFSHYFSNKTKSEECDSDSDVDLKDSIDNLSQSVDFTVHSQLLSFDSLETQKEIINANQNDEASLPNSGSITNSSTINTFSNDFIPTKNYPLFQDFLLDSNNFQVAEPMQAESVELEDFTSTDEDITDDDEGYVVASSILDLNKNDMTNGNDEKINYQRSKGITKIEGECHILEDGHFFYEKILDLDDDADEELECQSVLLSSDDIITTYKRPGAKVHFNLNKVRVYSTYLAREYNRKNEFINPLAASAEYEMEKRLDRMTIFPVDLYKGKAGLGISILGMGVDHSVGMKKLGIFIKQIVSGGAAETDGRIHIYDQVVEVNGQSLVSVTQQFAASVLRNTLGMVHFLIGREEDQSNSEIVKLVEKSRQLSGLTSDPTTNLDNRIEDNITKIKNVTQKNKDTEQDNDLISFKTSKEEDEYKTMTRSANDSNITKHYISTQTDEVCEVKTLKECKLNEKRMLETISELKNEVYHCRTMELEMKNLNMFYTEIKSQLDKCQCEKEEKEHIISELIYRNKLLEERCNAEKDEHRNRNENYNLDCLSSHSNEKIQQSQDLTYYLERIKLLENQVKYLEFKLISSVTTCESDNSQLSRHDAFMSLTPHSENKIKENLLQFSYVSDAKEINFMLNMDSVIETKTLPHIIDSNEDFPNNINELPELRSPDNLLDNEFAKNKSKLRKINQISNRKPPTKLMMIGNGSNIPPEVTVQLNESNSSMNYKESVLPVLDDTLKYSKNINSKIIGGFALPGKSEIRLGIKPSNVIGSKKTGRFDKDIIEYNLKTNSNETPEICESSLFERENKNEAVNTKSEIPLDNETISKKEFSENEYIVNDSLKLNGNKSLDNKNELYYMSPLQWDQNYLLKWLKSIGLDHIEKVLIKNGITNGHKLIRLDSNTIKKIGIVNSNDRLILKRNIKELRYLIENTFDINGNSNE